MIDFSWILYVGRSLLGYSDREVGRLTFTKWKEQYDHYKNEYDFRLAKVSYSKAHEITQQEEEWL